MMVEMETGGTEGYRRQRQHIPFQTWQHLRCFPGSWMDLFISQSNWSRDLELKNEVVNVRRGVTLVKDNDWEGTYERLLCLSCSISSSGQWLVTWYAPLEKLSGLCTCDCAFCFFFIVCANKD